MTISKALYSSRSEEWSTPQKFFDALNEEFHFVWDMAATRENAKCHFYVDKETDALFLDWYSHTTCEPGKPCALFCNPPYGKQIGRWFERARRAAEKGCTVVMLAHARTDTIWWHTHVQGIASEVRFVKGRLKFGDGKQSAPFPSAVIIYRPGVQS